MKENKVYTCISIVVIVAIVGVFVMFTENENKEAPQTINLDGNLVGDAVLKEINNDYNRGWNHISCQQECPLGGGAWNIFSATCSGTGTLACSCTSCDENNKASCDCGVVSPPSSATR